MARGYHGPPDPDKGKPNRHTVAKIELMLFQPPYPTPGQLINIITKIAEKRPEDTLDAVLAVLEPEG